MRNSTAILERKTPAWLTQGTAAVLSGRSKAAIRDLVRKRVLYSIVPSSFTTRRVIATASLEALMGREIAFADYLASEQCAHDFYRSQPENHQHA